MGMGQWERGRVGWIAPPCRTALVVALLALAGLGSARGDETPMATPGRDITEAERQAEIAALESIGSTWTDLAIEIRHDREERRLRVENTLLAEASRRREWQERREVVAARATERMARGDAAVCSSFLLFIALGALGWVLRSVWARSET